MLLLTAQRIGSRTLSCLERENVRPANEYAAASEAVAGVRHRTDTRIRSYLGCPPKRGFVERAGSGGVAPARRTFVSPGAINSMRGIGPAGGISAPIENVIVPVSLSKLADATFAASASGADVWF